MSYLFNLGYIESVVLCQKLNSTLTHHIKKILFLLVTKKKVSHTKISNEGA